MDCNELVSRLDVTVSVQRSVESNLGSQLGSIHNSLRSAIRRENLRHLLNRSDAKVFVDLGGVGWGGGPFVRSDEGLTLETAALGTLYGYQFTVLTQLKYPSLPQHYRFLETYPVLLFS